MEAMNVLGFAPHGFPRTARLRRVETVMLASSISIVALLVATFLHVVVGVQETPLVIGTIVVASIAGWINAYLPTDADAPSDGGRELDGDIQELGTWFDQAA